MIENRDETVERLLGMPYWVIDVLPCQVPPDSAGQFFAVEQYYLSEPYAGTMRRRFGEVLLGLNCYYSLHVDCGNGWVTDPEPEALVQRLTAAMHNGHLCALIEGEDALMTASGGNINITLYNPSPALLHLVQQLATAAGLFVWQPQEHR